MKAALTIMERQLSEACDRFAPRGWKGYNWLQLSDTVISKERAAHGLSGATRERARQVRAIIEKKLKESARTRALLRMRRGSRLKLKPLGPNGWHQPTSHLHVLKLLLEWRDTEPAVLAEMNINEIVARLKKHKVRCQAAWVLPKLREEQIVFKDTKGGSTATYPWQLISPLEWYLLSDVELGAKIGCNNVSVVAQYRERHNKLKKYNNTPLTILRRYLRHLPPQDRFSIVRRWLQGRTHGVVVLAAKEINLADRKHAAAIDMLDVVQLAADRADARVERFQRDKKVDKKVMAQRSAQRLLKVANRKVANAQKRVEQRLRELGEIRSRLPRAMTAFIELMQKKFPTEDQMSWFPVDVVQVARKAPTESGKERRGKERHQRHQTQGVLVTS